MPATVAGMKGFAQLSGSFAVAGLVASQSRTSRTAHAFYVDPALVVFKDVPYPIKKASGTLVTPDGPKASLDLMYCSFRKLSLCHTFSLKPLVVYMACSGIMPGIQQAQSIHVDCSRARGEPVTETLES